MKLRRIRLHGFGTFNRGLTIDLDSDKPTLILGQNEAGKSTILNAVTATLFGFRDQALRRRYEPWEDHEAYAASLDLETEDGRRLRLHRDFNTDQVRVAEVQEDAEVDILFDAKADPRGRGSDDAAYLDLLAGVLGFRDEGVFRQTVLFQQQGLETGLSDQIRRLLSGSSTMDYRAAQHELHRRYAELANDNPWRTRPPNRRRLIEKTSGDLRDQEARLEKARTAMNRSLELEAELAGLEDELVRLETQLGDKDEILDVHERLLPLRERQGEVDARWNDIRAQRDRREAQAQRVKEIEAYANQRFAHFRRTPANLPDLIKSYRDQQKDGVQAEERLARERQAFSELKPKANEKNGALLGIGLGAVAGIAAITVPPLAMPLGIAALPLAGIGFALGRRLGTGFQEERTAWAERINALEAEVAAHRRHARETLGRAGPALVGKAPEEVLAEYSAFAELRKERQALLDAIQALGDRKELEKRFDEASRERARLETALEELKVRCPALSEGMDTAKLTRRIDELRAEREQLATRTRESRRRLEECRLEQASLAGRLEVNLAELAEGVRDNRQRLSDLDRERQALKLAIDTLDACVAEFQELDLEKLEDEVSRIFRQITNDRYKRVAIEPSLDPVVKGDEDENILPEELSQGARDQLYFAMRVAMGEHLSHQIRLPLLLDDPFVNFDAGRRDEARRVLDTLGDHQVIMMSCHPDYREWTDHVIDLDALRANAETN